MSFLSALFGGSSSKSSNTQLPFLQKTLTPAINTGVNAFNDLSGALSGGFDAFKKNSGFDFTSLLGTKAITGNAAASGLLNSGSTAKALTDYTTGLGSQSFGNYLDKLGGLVQGGQNFAQILSGAGQQSKSSSSNGILPTLFG